MHGPGRAQRRPEDAMAAQLPIPAKKCLRKKQAHTDYESPCGRGPALRQLGSAAALNARSGPDAVHLAAKRLGARCQPLVLAAFGAAQMRAVLPMLARHRQGIGGLGSGHHQPGVGLVLQQLLHFLRQCGCGQRYRHGRCGGRCRWIGWLQLQPEQGAGATGRACGDPLGLYDQRQRPAGWQGSHIRHRQAQWHRRRLHGLRRTCCLRPDCRHLQSQRKMPLALRRSQTALLHPPVLQQWRLNMASGQCRALAALLQRSSGGG